MTVGGADNKQQVTAIRQSITQKGTYINGEDTRRIKSYTHKTQGTKAKRTNQKTNSKTGDKR